MRSSTLVPRGTLVFVVMAITTTLAIPAARFALGQEATPSTYSCDALPAGAASTPALDQGMMDETETASPAAGMEMDMDIDVLYIDMMIPHHASIIALADAALPRLTDERLQQIAQAIIDIQTAEIEELGNLRAEIAGSAMPMPMDDTSMGMMMEMMPGMGSMEEMATQMDPAAQVTAFCEADNPDLAFIDLTIPHHESAIAASEAVVAQSIDDEILAFAERVIADQQAEIELLMEIRDELTGS
ncbi:MAG: DUF305 domain-containing protein [Chloroflexia bacterium]|nr:DUF305 domain-containing protein [Chloroflexia bacterium]